MNEESYLWANWIVWKIIQWNFGWNVMKTKTIYPWLSLIISHSLCHFHPYTKYIYWTKCGIGFTWMNTFYAYNMQFVRFPAINPNGWIRRETILLETFQFDDLPLSFCYRSIESMNEYVIYFFSSADYCNPGSIHISFIISSNHLKFQLITLNEWTKTCQWQPNQFDFDARVWDWVGLEYTDFELNGFWKFSMNNIQLIELTISFESNTIQVRNVHFHHHSKVGILNAK